METWIDLGGLTLRSPVTAFTNLLLSVQCALYWRRLLDEGGERARYWALFFLAMAVATLAGVPKHGLAHVLPGGVYALVLWISGLGGAASVYCAQRATLPSRTAAGSDWPARLCALQAAVFVAVAGLLGPEMWLVVVNTVVGLMPVIVVESLRVRHGSRAAAWTLAGLGVSFLPGFVYVGRLSPGVWFNHIDLAHVLMAVSFWLMVRGGAPETGLRSPAGAAPYRPAGESARPPLAGVRGGA